MISRNFTPEINFKSYDDFYNNFKLNVPRFFNFAYDVVDVLAQENPGRPALVWCDEKGNEKYFNFRDMRKYSSQAAHFFRSCGVRKGDRVMLLLKRRYEFWFCLLALHRIGAVAIPATSLLSSKDIAYRVQSARVNTVVACNDPALLKRIDDIEQTLAVKVIVGGCRIGWRDFDTEYLRMPDYYSRPDGTEAISSEDPMLVFFTSGTTGMPKMVAHSFDYPLGHIVTAQYWQCVHEGKLHLTLAESGWAKAMWGKIYGQWLCGAVVFVYDFERFSSKNMLHMLSKYRVATFCAPPTVYRLLFEEDFANYDLTALECCSIAGEACERELFEEFYSRTGLALKEAYGQTETTVAIGNFPWMQPRPGSMGRPAPGYVIELFNDKGEPCGPGEKGQIAIRVDPDNRQAGLFRGYLDDVVYTGRVWHDGFYFTGDIALRDGDGCFWFVGRADSMIKSSGYRISPFEVESVLLQHPAVRACIVRGVPDRDRGQAVKAKIVLNKNYAPGRKLIKDLQDHVKSLTAPYKYPRFIEFTDAISRNANGKIER